MAWLHVPNQKRHTQDGCQLVHLMKPAPRGKMVKAVDVGCGDGIVTFEMLRLHKANSVVGIDISKFAINAARKNLNFALNTNVQILKKSAKAFFEDRRIWDSFDRFVINPPFFVSGSGRENKTKLDQLSRHEGSLKLNVWALGAKRLLKTGGELYCVFPSERLSECLAALTRYRVEPKELWWLREDQRKRRFFLRAVRNAKPGLKIHFDVTLKGVTQGENA